MYKGMIVADAHCDTVIRALDGHDLTRDDPDCHLDAPKLRAGGVDLQVFALWTHITTMPKRASNRLLTLSVHLNSFLRSASDTVAIARSYADFEKNLAEGKTSAVLAIEGAHCLPPDEGSIDFCHALGVRILTLCWNNANWLASSSSQADLFPYGLTPLGRKVVRRMCECGVIPDLSHASEKAFWDVASICDKPFIVSHSCAKGVCNHHRNLDDEQIRAIAHVNGVIGVNFLKGFLKSEPGATIDDAVAHIEYILDLVGDEHVGFGSDFDGFPSGPEGLETAKKFPALIDLLLDKGLSEESVRKIAGGNILRVFKELCG